MQEDLLLKVYSPHTQTVYLRGARHFASHYMRSPEEMGEEEIRGFLLYQVRDRKASPATQGMYVNALEVAQIFCHHSPHHRKAPPARKFTPEGQHSRRSLSRRLKDLVG
jgi:hypothetical protein